MKRLILFIISAILLCGLLLAVVGCSGSETENPEETTAGNPETTTGGNEETTTGGGEETTTGGGEESTTGGDDTEPHVHAFGEWTTVTEATCTAEGQKERVCACGEKETEKIPVTKHNFANNVCAICGKKVSEGLIYTKDGNGGYIVSIGTCTDLDIVIPSEYNGKPVTRIGGDAFRECSSLTSITIPDSVTSIGEYAFCGCSSLTSITIPNSVTSIGEYAFRECSSLASVTIENGVTSIGKWAFYECSNLTSIAIPDSVTSIGSSAFSDTAYYNDDSNWTNGVLYIGDHLIKTKSNSVSGAYTIKDGTKCIAGSAFSGCSSLRSITIPNSATSIGYRAFYGCSSLTSIIIPDSVTSIGYAAFSGCSSLTSISLPFTGDKVHAATDTYQYPFGYIFGTGSYTGGIATEQYYYASISDKTSSTYYIPSSLKSVTITGKVINNRAFYNCSNLTSITIPDGVTSIGEATFYGCSGLTSITIPDSVTSIGYAAFYQCGSLTSIMIPDSVTNIGDYAFNSCYNLTNITIPDSVTSIGKYAFYNTGYYNNDANWTDDVLYIGKYLVAARDSISDVYVVKNGTKCIAGSAFYKCEGLTSITIPNSVTSIGDYAFEYCENLISITIPDGVTSIGREAFYECSSLTSITFTGTKAEWEAISKGSYWNYNTGSYVIHCTDGDITK